MKNLKSFPHSNIIEESTEEELRRIENLKLYNEYGMIEFEEPVNLLKINLDKDIMIKQGAL